LKVSAIVLAAGSSQRMGRDKLALPWGSTTVLGRVIATLRESGVKEIVLVVGPGAWRPREAGSCRMIVNPDPMAGMGNSLTLGAQAAASDAEGLLIALGDMPLVDASLVRAVLEKGSQELAVVPRNGERWGHPVLFGASFRSDLESLSGRHGARAVLERQPERIRFLDWPHERAFEDLDTPEDYERLRPRDGS
jgi:molybdenum cofactor cytidylyltransferase